MWKRSARPGEEGGRGRPLASLASCLMWCTPAVRSFGERRLPDEAQTGAEAIAWSELQRRTASLVGPYTSRGLRKMRCAKARAVVGDRERG